MKINLKAMNTSFEEMLNKNIVQESTKSVHITIDGQCIEGTPTEHNQFVEFFNELETLLMSDDKKYWILYDAVNPETPFFKEYFWCIPTSEIDFVWKEEDGWHYVPAGITREDDIFTKIEKMEEYNRKLKLYYEFEKNFAEYMMANASDEIWQIWKSMRKWTTPKYKDIADDNKVCLVTYLEEYWNAWFMSIVNQEFKYMNLTQTVWDSWLER